MTTDPIYIALSTAAGVILAWFKFKADGRDAVSKFQESLLSRIETLEEDNEVLRKKNEELLLVNTQERKRQLELEAKITGMENEKLTMLDRIQHLEDLVEQLMAKITKLEATRGSKSS
jgi:chromosome segregation ATPase